MHESLNRLSRLKQACMEAHALGCPHTASVLEKLIQGQLMDLKAASSCNSLDATIRHRL